MAKDSRAIPFARGKVVDDGSTYDKAYWEGMECVFEYTSPTSPALQRDGRFVRCRLVRNVSGITLTGKRLVKYAATAGVYGTRVDGYCNVTAERVAGVTDEFLPSSGVPDGDLFWIVVEGPTVCKMPQTAVADIAVGNRLVALTAAASTGATAGNIGVQSLAGATQPLGDQVQNAFAYALSAVNSTSTGSDVLVDVVKIN